MCTEILPGPIGSHSDGSEVYTGELRMGNFSLELVVRRDAVYNNDKCYSRVYEDLGNSTFLITRKEDVTPMAASTMTFKGDTGSACKARNTRRRRLIMASAMF